MHQRTRFFVPLTIAVFLSFAGQAIAGNVRVVCWNAKELFTPQSVQTRADDLKKFVTETKPDILLLQEVTSRAVVDAFNSVSGFNAPHVACSDFVQNDNNQHGSFEVAILSRYALDQVIEYDHSPDNSEGGPDEISLEALLKIGIDEVNTSRGYLWARVATLNLNVFVTHLKSSNGRIGSPDKSNAAKRELVAAAIAAGVNEDLAFFEDTTCLVAGDLNVGRKDQKKNGIDLEEECFKADCDGQDRYDETHALLRHGLVGGLQMSNLTDSIPGPTYVFHSSSFGDTGPIDNIYVAGSEISSFSEATRAEKAYGSDHYAVWTDFETDLALPPIVTEAITETAAETIRVCSFNIQFLGNSNDRDDPALASILDGYDIVLIQELVSPPYAGFFPDGTPFNPDDQSAEFFDEMVALGFDYVLSEEDTGTGDTIHRNGSSTEWWVAFYDPDTIDVAGDLPGGFLADDRSNHPDYERVPYAFPFRATDNPADFVLISVHLKPGSSSSSKSRRKHELAAIGTWIDNNDATEKDFLIVGDMNIENATELSDATPTGFLSLNDEGRATNTNVNGPKPYDHAMYRAADTTEVSTTFDMAVVDLIAAMQPHWVSSDPYPGDPYDHNTFRRYYSDHHPVVFELTLPATDDD